jgi:hypothetical protein
VTPLRTAARPGRRARRLGLAACVLVSVFASALVVWQSAYATFADSAAPVPATMTTGTLTLGDDDTEQALFSVSGVKPGESGERCIRVTAGGTVPAKVRMYGTGRSSAKGLATSLTLTVQTSTGGSALSCNDFRRPEKVYTGTLAGFTAEGFAAGLGEWSTTGGAPESRSYRISWSLPAGAPLSVQGGSAGLTFVWEARTR